MENNRKPANPAAKAANMFSIVKQETRHAKQGGSIVIQIPLKEAAKERAKTVLYKKDSEFWLSND